MKIWLRFMTRLSEIRRSQSEEHQLICNPIHKVVQKYFICMRTMLRSFGVCNELITARAGISPLTLTMPTATDRYFQTKQHSTCWVTQMNGIEGPENPDSRNGTVRNWMCDVRLCIPGLRDVSFSDCYLRLVSGYAGELCSCSSIPSDRENSRIACSPNVGLVVVVTTVSHPWTSFVGRCKRRTVLHACSWYWQYSWCTVMIFAL